MKSLIEQGKLLSLSFPVLVALWEQVETFLDAFQIIVKHRPSLCVAPTALDVRMQPTHPSRLSRFAGSPSGWANLWARLTALGASRVFEALSRLKDLHLLPPTPVPVHCAQNGAVFN